MSQFSQPSVDLRELTLAPIENSLSLNSGESALRSDSGEIPQPIEPRITDSMLGGPSTLGLTDPGSPQGRRTPYSSFPHVYTTPYAGHASALTTPGADHASGLSFEFEETHSENLPSRRRFDSPRPGNASDRSIPLSSGSSPCLPQSEHDLSIGTTANRALGPFIVTRRSQDPRAGMSSVDWQHLGVFCSMKQSAIINQNSAKSDTIAFFQPVDPLSIHRQLSISSDASRLGDPHAAEGPCGHSNTRVAATIPPGMAPNPKTVFLLSQPDDGTTKLEGRGLEACPTGRGHFATDERWLQHWLGRPHQCTKPFVCKTCHMGYGVEWSWNDHAGTHEVAEKDGVRIISCANTRRLAQKLVAAEARPTTGN